MNDIVGLFDVNEGGGAGWFDWGFLGGFVDGGAKGVLCCGLMAAAIWGMVVLVVVADAADNVVVVEVTSLVFVTTASKISVVDDIVVDSVS